MQSRYASYFNDSKYIGYGIGTAKDAVTDILRQNSGSMVYEAGKVYYLSVLVVWGSICFSTVKCLTFLDVVICMITKGFLLVTSYIYCS